MKPVLLQSSFKASLLRILRAQATTLTVLIVSAALALWDVFDVFLTESESSIGAEHGVALYTTFQAVCALLEPATEFIEDVQELMDL